MECFERRRKRTSPEYSNRFLEKSSASVLLDAKKNERSGAHGSEPYGRARYMTIVRKLLL